MVFNIEYSSNLPSFNYPSFFPIPEGVECLSVCPPGEPGFTSSAALSDDLNTLSLQKVIELAHVAGHETVQSPPVLSQPTLSFRCL